MNAAPPALSPSALPSDDRSQQAFCSGLKAARERRGITLAALAESTKVGASHFAALERGDISRWPKGLYRRSFFRSYVSAIGLPPESMLGEFLRHFPDEDDGATEPTNDASESAVGALPSELRLTMGRDSRREVLQRLCSRSAMIDSLVVLMLVSIIAWWSGAGVAAAVATLAVCIYPHAARGIRQRRAVAQHLKRR